MPAGGDDSEFDEWFDATFEPRGDEPPPARVDALRSWARRLFTTSGPVERDVVAVAYQFDQLAAVESALAMVIDDLSVVSPRVPTTEVDAYDLGARITVDGGFSEPSIHVQHPFDVSEAAVEIVEYIRERMSQDETVSFPVCSRHEHFYLYPIIENGIGVWRCNRGDHVVAPIGHLHSL
jgi:hypothetical protein